MKTFVIGDIHGAYKALVQVLERSGFDKDKDVLISLGDIADGWHQAPECINELLTIDKLIAIRGNHDEWLYEWLRFGIKKSIWLNQGGFATMNAYLNDDFDRDLHLTFLSKQIPYYIDDNNRLFVHGGFNWKVDIDYNEPHELMWDRKAFYTACMWAKQNTLNSFKNFNEVFVGHTATNHNLESTVGNSLEPVHVANIWNLDQGAGYDGKLTLMDVDSKEYWQSDLITDLYPGMKGR